LTVQPTVLVELAETAQLEAGGAAAVIALTVACPVGTNGIESRPNISQSGRTSGNGTYTPICDGARHTFDVRVQASERFYRPGEAVALRSPTSSTRDRSSTVSTMGRSSS
jgi:hypothetical protein